MNKILFVLSHRSGSNLWQLLAGKRKVNFYASKALQTLVGAKDIINEASSRRAYKGEWEGSEHSFFLPTLPNNICPCENSYIRSIEETLESKPPFNYFAWHVHTGNWWGELPSKDIPSPYDVITPTRLGPSEISSLPGDPWTVVSLVRDGRNQIESFRRLQGGIEEEYMKNNPGDYFIALCKGFRNKARMAIDCNSLPFYRIFKFEDIIKDPVSTIGDMLCFCGLQSDPQFIKNAYNLSREMKTYKQHSSFGNNPTGKNRWNLWTLQEKSIFKDIAGNELIELGYEVNNDW